MELFFIIILALIILGPRDMQKAGMTMGKWLNKLVRSDTWKLIRQASNKIKYLPNELMREAGLEDIKKASIDINQVVNKEISQTIKDISQSTMDPFQAWREQNLTSLPSNPDPLIPGSKNNIEEPPKKLDNFEKPDA
jgi:Sec-independent protein translocase protein TatA